MITAIVHKVSFQSGSTWIEISKYIDFSFIDIDNIEEFEFLENVNDPKSGNAILTRPAIFKFLSFSYDKKSVSDCDVMNNLIDLRESSPNTLRSWFDMVEPGSYKVTPRWGGTGEFAFVSSLVLERRN